MVERAGVLQVHYFGRLSVHDVSRIGGVDEFVVADFFNTVSNVKLAGSLDDGTACSEPRFPFGGYWQAMREGTTAGDIRRLRALVHTVLGEDSEHVENADTFRAWYQPGTQRYGPVLRPHETGSDNASPGPTPRAAMLAS
jgi:hypothetical protein